MEDESSFNPGDSSLPEFDEEEISSPWDAEGAIESLAMERSVSPDESNETLTRRLLAEAAPAAAQSIIHVALHSANDNSRLNAAKYITDKLLDSDNSIAKQSWEDLVGEVVSKAELTANGAGPDSN